MPINFTLFQQLVHGFESPFFVIHDRAGRILNSTGLPVREPHPVFADIIKQGTLEGYFDLTGLPPAIRNGYAIRGKPVKVYPLYQHTLYYGDPLHLLVLYNLGPGTFISQVRVMEMAPPARLNIGLSFIFSELEGRTLKGFEETVRPFFLNDPGGDLIRLLDRPLSEFLTPTPAEFQEHHLSNFKIEDIASFRKIFELSLRSSQPGLLLNPPGGTVKCDEDGWLFRAPEESPLFLRFPPLFNSETRDVAATVRLQLLRGFPPYLAIGKKTETGIEPDWNGYMGGFSTDRKRAIIKRTGFILVNRALQDEAGKTLALSFCKIGKSLLLFQDKNRAAGFFDEEFLFASESQVSLVLRPGSECRILSADLHDRSTVAVPGGPVASHHVARFVRRPDKYCILSRFYNHTLDRMAASGYQPVDITALQSEIMELDKKKGYFEKRTLVLGALLDNYQVGEGAFIGSSDVIQRIRKTAQTAALSDATVLIEGPTGSGKEVLAGFIHSHSGRKGGPFITVDCATIPRELIESHLFGHEKGAFTGATARNIGLLERAEKGTLFLDEAGNLPPDIQAKLLRFFNDHTITRVGGGKAIRVDARCLLASNRSLREMVVAGAFRADLYYRINVVSLTLPPLRERASDIPELCHHFIRRFAALNSKSIRDIDPAALSRLRAHDWPGNVRELGNVIERAVVFCRGDTVLPELIQFGESGAAPAAKRRKPRPAFTLTRTDPERIRALLKAHAGNVTAAARELGVERVSLHLHLKRIGVRAEDYRRGF